MFSPSPLAAMEGTKTVLVIISHPFNMADLMQHVLYVRPEATSVCVCAHKYLPLFKGVHMITAGSTAVPTAYTNAMQSVELHLFIAEVMHFAAIY